MQIFVFATLLVTVVLFVADRVRVDLVALATLLVLTLGGALTVEQALAGFASPVVVVLAALFVVGEGLRATGAAARLARGPARRVGGSEPLAVVATMLLAAFLSALMSSTGAVAVMIPVVLSLSRSASLPPSRLLLPMAFAAQLGGLLTLIGTPPNLVASDALAEATGTGFGFFTITPIGLLILAVAVVLLATAGRVLLPSAAAADEDDTPSQAELGERFELDHTLQSTEVQPGSPLIGQTLAEAALRSRHRVNVLQIERRGRAVAPEPDTTLQAGDVLALQGAASAVQALEEAMGLAPRDEREGRVEGQLATDIGLVELVIMPRSKLVGRTLQEARFGDRFGVTVVSIKRGERRLRDRVSRTVLRFGDALLVAGPWARIALLRRERREFLVVTEPEEAKEAAETPEREGLAIAVVVAMLVAMALGWVPVVIASLAAALAMVLGGAVRVPMVYRSISGPSVVLVAAMLPVATALEASGAIDTIVGGLEAWTVGRPAAVALLLLMLLTSLLSQVISNTATSVLLAPVGVELARALGIDPAPLLLGLAVAASSAFTTPMASPVNTLVLGPGNYRFVDYVRAGVPLQILTVLGGWAAIAWTM